jgi:hypothetical protein
VVRTVVEAIEPRSPRFQARHDMAMSVGDERLRKNPSRDASLVRDDHDSESTIE